MIVPRAVSGACQRRTGETGCFINTGVENMIKALQSVFRFDCTSTAVVRSTPCVNSGSYHVGSAHLIIHDCSPELVNEVDYFLRIFRFVKESCRLFLLQYGLRTLSNFLQGAEYEVRASDGERGGVHLESSPRRFSSSGSTSAVTAVRLSFSFFSHGMSWLTFSLTFLYS